MYHRSSTYALGVGFASGAENLAYHDYSLSASQAHNIWMDSGVHRRNMLDPAMTSAGFGIACSTKSGRPYAVAVVEFGGDSPPARSTPPAEPQIAGRGSVDGVGCSASDVDPLPAPARITSPPGGNSSPPQNGDRWAGDAARVGLADGLGSSPPPRSKPAASPAAGGRSDPNSIAATPTASAQKRDSENSSSDRDPTCRGPAREAPITAAHPAKGEDQLSREQSPPPSRDAPSEPPQSLDAASASARRPAAARWVASVLTLALGWAFLLRVIGVRGPRPRRRARHSYR